MKRAVLKQLAATLASQVDEKPFEHWVAQQYPIIWEQEHEGQLVQVEIERLELGDDFIHLAVSVDGGGLSAFLPATANRIVKKST